MSPDREGNVDAKIARVDQHLTDFEREVNRRFSTLEDAVKSANGRVLGLAISIAGSSVVLALTTLLATGKI